MKIGENYKREKEETMDKRKVKWSKERKERWLAARWGRKEQEDNKNSPSPQNMTTPIEQ